jgi:hypothetical protein
MSDQCTDADDRVVDMSGKLIAHRDANFVVALAVMTISGGEACDVGDRFDVPKR